MGARARVLVAALLVAAGEVRGGPAVGQYGYHVTGQEKFMKDKWKSPIINHEHKLIVCSIPKCGSTSLRQLMRVLIPNSGTWKNRDETHYWVASNARHLSDYSPAQVEEYLNDPTYAKVAVVRHPVERLLSGYVDKIIKSKYGERLYKIKDMSFATFVQKVSQERPPHCGFNEHWQNLTCFCGLDHLSHMYQLYRLEDSPQVVRDLVASGHVPEAKVIGGFGKFGNESLFRHRETDPTAKLGSMHNTESKVHQFYTRELLEKVKLRYGKDFDILQVLDRYKYDAAVSS